MGHNEAAKTCGCKEGYYRKRNCDSASVEYELREEDTCEPCPFGTYNPYSGGVGADACLPCPKGTYNDETGKESRSDCKNCSTNYYAASPGQEECSECPEGKFNSAEGSTSCEGTCNRMCSKCFGTGRDQCYKCREEIPNVTALGAMTCGCERGHYYDEAENIGPEEYCRPCENFCSYCVEAKMCLACIEHHGIQLINGECKCSVPGYTLHTSQETARKECTKCHPLCIACHGAAATQCDSCSELRGAFLVRPNTCSCSAGRYYESSAEKCEVCHPLCSSCFGPSNRECGNCAYGLVVEGEANMCVAYCEEGYYLDHKVCKSKA